MTKSPKSVFVGLRLDADLAHAMAKLQARDGISTSEQIRRALKAFLRQKLVYKEKKS